MCTVPKTNIRIGPIGPHLFNIHHGLGSGVGQGGGGGGHLPAGVPSLPGPHHPSSQAVPEGTPHLLRLLPPAAPLPHLQRGHVSGEEPGHGAGGRPAAVSLQVSPHGVQGGLSADQEGEAREGLSFPAAQVSLPRTGNHFITLHY